MTILPYKPKRPVLLVEPEHHGCWRLIALVETGERELLHESVETDEAISWIRRFRFWGFSFIAPAWMRQRARAAT